MTLALRQDGINDATHFSRVRLDLHWRTLISSFGKEGAGGQRSLITAGARRCGGVSMRYSVRLSVQLRLGKNKRQSGVSRRLAVGVRGQVRGALRGAAGAGKRVVLGSGEVVARGRGLKFPRAQRIFRAYIGQEQSSRERCAAELSERRRRDPLRAPLKGSWAMCCDSCFLFSLVPVSPLGRPSSSQGTSCLTSPKLRCMCRTRTRMADDGSGGMESASTSSAGRAARTGG